MLRPAGETLTLKGTATGSFLPLRSPRGRAGISLTGALIAAKFGIAIDHETSMSVADACRKAGITERTFAGNAEVRRHGRSRTASPENEVRRRNKKLKALVADLALDKHMLKEMLAKVPKADTGRDLVTSLRMSALQNQRAPRVSPIICTFLLPVTAIAARRKTRRHCGCVSAICRPARGALWLSALACVAPARRLANQP